MFVLRVELCVFAETLVERKTKYHDHVTMDGVRCKLLAVWKTCVQTDWQTGCGGARVEDRAVREERWWVTGPAVILFKPSPPLTRFPVGPPTRPEEPRPLFLSSAGPHEIHGSGSERNTLKSTCRGSNACSCKLWRWLWKVFGSLVEDGSCSKPGFPAVPAQNLNHQSSPHHGRAKAPPESSTFSDVLTNRRSGSWSSLLFLFDLLWTKAELLSSAKEQTFQSLASSLQKSFLIL